MKRELRGRWGVGRDKMGSQGLKWGWVGSKMGEGAWMDGGKARLGVLEAGPPP